MIRRRAVRASSLARCRSPSLPRSTTGPPTSSQLVLSRSLATAKLLLCSGPQQCHEDCYNGYHHEARARERIIPDSDGNGSRVSGRLRDDPDGLTDIVWVVGAGHRAGHPEPYPAHI